MREQTQEPLNRPEGKENAIFRYGRVIVFCLLVFMLIVLIVVNLKNWYFLLPISAVLLIENSVKIWAFKTYPPKIVCYVLDMFALLFLTYFSDGTLISIIYIIILSEFYLTQEKLAGSIAMCVCSAAIFLGTFAISNALDGEEVRVANLIASAFSDLLIIAIHFLVFNFAIQIYRKNKEITGTLVELNASNEKLRLAYNELQEITVLEERQRIAKDIHDTAGHSITTVIMQTEAAKLIIDNDPTDAKRKISAANLQAKHALEELRESVHLLSGTNEYLSLKDKLARILHESADGTGIAVRSDVDDIQLCDAKSRFVCNTLKEGISNGMRHGGATAFYFELKDRDGQISFLLSDNGAGMDLSALREGFGLTGMHRRAESLGGQVWFETAQDEGFEIHLTLPKDGGGEERK